MTVSRWDWEKERYNTEIIPDDRKISLYSDDMDKQIQCVTCGTWVRFGDTYTSMEIHNFMGFGFMVCEECHGREMVRRYGANAE